MKTLSHIVCVGGEDHPLRIPYIHALQERQYRVTAVSTGLGSAFADAGIDHHHCQFDRFSSGRGDLGKIGNFRRLLSSLKPDIVHSFDTKPNLLVPFALRGSSAVVRTINGLGWTFSTTQARALALRPIYASLQRIASFWTSATVFQNNDDMALFKKWRLLGPGVANLIGSSGIDVKGFERQQKAGPHPDQLRHELGLQGAEIVIYVGRLTRQKGIPTLLKAVPLVLAQRPSAKFVLVGPLESEGPFAVDPASLERLAPHVVHLGRRQDVPSLLGMANVFAFPTEYREGIPRVLLEAGLAGLAIVASKKPGCTDVVLDGVNGYLVPPQDPQALASRIIDLLGDPACAADMGKISKSIVEQKFELKLVVDAYCAVYDSILKSNRAGRYRREPLQVDLRHRQELSGIQQ